ncbi:MAG: glutathione S-transferase family protein [Pseudomonadales bacterium]
MLKLYGAPLSNYYNMVKCALLEKQIPFEAVMNPPSQEETYLAKSAMGKIPCLETDQGYLAETHAILDYLEDLQPSPALLPADAFARAKVRELVQSLELYIELVARRGLGVLFGREVAESVKDSMRADLPKGIAAVSRLCRFSPWIAGDTFTYADLFAYWTFTLGNVSAKANADIDLLASIPGAQAWFDRVALRPSIVKALEDQAAARKARGA